MRLPRATIATAVGTVLLFLALLGAGQASAVYNGYPANPAGFPWLATIFYRDGSVTVEHQYCGGSLIAADVIVTAAHCVDGLKSEDLNIWFGYRTPGRTSVRARGAPVVEPRFNRKTLENDVALIFLTARVGRTPVTTLSKRPSRSTWLTGLGFGCQDEPVTAQTFWKKGCSRATDHLQGVALKVVDEHSKDCLPYRVPGTFCVNGFKSSLNHGDSGGPVLLQQGSQWKLAGVVESLQHTTEDYTNGVTPISEHWGWIADQLKAHATTSAPVPGGAHPQHVYGTCADGACGLTRRAGPGFTGVAAVGRLKDGDQVDVVCQQHGERVTPRRGTASDVWDRLADGSWISDVYVDTPGTGGGFSPGLAPCDAPQPEPSTPPAPVPPPASPPPPAPVPSPAPGPAPVDRTAIASYDRMAPGAPHHGYFDVAWQPFVAASNTITQLGVTVGTPALTAGVAVPYAITVRLCSAQPASDGTCPGQLVEAHPQIVNYGNSVADLGDVAISPGATYWALWLQPPPANGSSWVTYWWGGGSGIGASDQMQLVVRGYNR